MIHDTQPDYYGKYLATCSSDQTVKIFDLQSKAEVAKLVGHTGPVWQVAWSHPRFGPVLASCGYDGSVIVWKQLQTGWGIFYHHKLSDSANSVAFAPHEYGLILASGSSDGKVTVLTFKEDTQSFQADEFHAHNTGCNSVSFGPFLRPGALTATAEGAAPLTLATAGCDNNVIVWEYSSEGAKWSNSATLSHHKDWVRDVAWAPNIGLPVSYIASCSQDHTCVLWRLEEHGQWSSIELPKFTAPVWRVSWSITGNILAVASGDNQVTLWKEVADKEWRQISSVTESGVTES